MFESRAGLRWLRAGKGVWGVAARSARASFQEPTHLDGCILAVWKSVCICCVFALMLSLILRIQPAVFFSALDLSA
jgi:hypothetical protein